MKRGSLGFGLASAAILFVVRAAAQVDSLAPVIAGLDPSTASAGAPGLTLSVTGSGFRDAGICATVCGLPCPGRSVILVDGASVSTRFLSSTRLQAELPASLFSTPRSAAVTADNSITVQCGATDHHVSTASVLQIGAAPNPRVERFGTFLGGAHIDRASAIAAGPDGSIYVAGNTYSSDFPTTGGVLETDFGGPANPLDMVIGRTPRQAVFVAKFSADETRLLWSTYLHGSNNITVTSMAVDRDGSVVLGGNTDSSDLPVSADSFQGRLKPLGAVSFRSTIDAFVARLSGDGNTIQALTYLGGNDVDSIQTLALDGAGNIWVAGNTSSPDFPVTDAPAVAISPAGISHGFVAWLSGDCTKLLYGSYIAGSKFDTVKRLALDRAGNIWIAGNTGSTDLPVTDDALNPKAPGGFNSGFLARFNGAGAGLEYLSYFSADAAAESTYLDGIAVDGPGNIWLIGSSDSTGIFAARLNDTASAVLTLKPFPSLNNNFADVAADASGNAYLVGTALQGVPTTADAPAPSLHAGACMGGAAMFAPPQAGPCSDAFLLQLNAAGDILFGTYLGGAGHDFGTAVTVDSGGTVYIAGSSQSDKLLDLAPGFQPSRDAGACTYWGSPTFFTSFPCDDALVIKVGQLFPAATGF